MKTFTHKGCELVDDVCGRKIITAHIDEAERLGAEFTNFMWSADYDGCTSKTTKGLLTTYENSEGSVQHELEGA